MRDRERAHLASVAAAAEAVAAAGDPPDARPPLPPGLRHLLRNLGLRVEG